MATEKRLIDANVLFLVFGEEAEKIEIGVKDHMKRATSKLLIHWCMEQVAKAPKVDAVEVVHGRWEDMYGGKYANPRFRCSVCKQKALYVEVSTMLGNWRDEQDLSNYCHNCGAKMDKEE